MRSLPFRCLTAATIAVSLVVRVASSQEASAADPFVLDWQFNDWHIYARGAALSADGRWMSAADEENRVNIWDNSQNHAIRPLQSEGFFDTFAASDDGSVLVVSARWPEGPTSPKHATPFYLRFWSIPAGNVIATLDLDRPAERMAVTGDGKFIVLQMSQRSSLSWQIGSNRTPSEVLGLGKVLRFGAGLYAGHLLTADTGDAKDTQTITLWNTSTWKAERMFKAPCIVASAAMSPDGKRIAAGCRDPVASDGLHYQEDAPVVLWDVASGQLLKTFRGHDADVLSVIFTPDSRWLLSSSTELLMWNADSGGFAWKADCRNWRSGFNWMSNLSMTTDGKLLIVNCNRSVVLLRRVAEIAVRNLPSDSKISVGGPPPPPGKPTAPISRERLLADITYVFNRALARRLNDLKTDPKREIDVSRFVLTGARFCGIAEYLPGSTRVKALSMECHFSGNAISSRELLDIAQQAAPQLKWVLHPVQFLVQGLEKDWVGLDATNEIIINLGSSLRRDLSGSDPLIEIVEPR